MTYPDGLTKLASRAKLAQGALALFLIFASAAALGEFLEAFGLVNVAVGDDQLTGVLLLVYLGYPLTFLASVVAIAMWIHRAHANLAFGDAQDLQFTPGWAVGWYFIPIANLFKPFEAMRELWNASHPGRDVSAGKAVPIIVAWWTAWLLGNILSGFGTRIAMIEREGAYEVGSGIGAVGTVAAIVAAALLLKIVKRVTLAQRAGGSATGVFA